MNHTLAASVASHRPADCVSIDATMDNSPVAISAAVATIRPNMFCQCLHQTVADPNIHWEICSCGFVRWHVMLPEYTVRLQRSHAKMDVLQIGNWPACFPFKQRSTA
ncbi:TPA: hypothetical protein ACH3X3_001232 [Trebouxia sp. C0006]